MKKICSKCGEKKDVGEFHKSKNGKYGVRGDCKVCNRKRVSKYHHENREVRNKNAAKWRAKNKEHVEEYRKNHYAENKDYYNEKSKKWHKENKDKARAIAKKGYEKNKIKILQKQKEYYEENKDRIKARVVE